MKQTLQKATILYDTTFPEGTILDYEALNEMGIVCAITIPVPQKILDHSSSKHQLVVENIVFPAQTTFFYKQTHEQALYGSQRVPRRLLLVNDLVILGTTLPASTEWTFLTSIQEDKEQEATLPDNVSNSFRSTLLGVLQERITLQNLELRPKTRLLFTEREWSWSYQQSNAQEGSIDTKGTLIKYRSFVEKALEEGHLEAVHYEALHFLATDYFKNTIEWSSTLLGHYYKEKGEKERASSYYSRAYRLALAAQGPSATEVQQLDYWLSKLRLGVSTTEKKYVLRRFYLTNILIILVLFYTAVHLREEEMAVLEGLRPQLASFDWASTAYALANLAGSVFALYAGWRAFAVLRRIGIILLGMASIGLFYSLYVLATPEKELMDEVLLVYGPYIVFSMWVNGYALMLKDKEILEEEER
ncbi:MAG: hypothetical protein ACRBFS_13255 [Aureispira sp.]